jgi:hypothetical protein
VTAVDTRPQSGRAIVLSAIVVSSGMSVDRRVVMSINATTDSAMSTRRLSEQKP